LATSAVTAVVVWMESDGLFRVAQVANHY